MNNHRPILGTTIYSFTNEWLQRMYTLDEEVRKVAELDLGPAVEIVGFQSIREYPDVSDEFAKHFRELLDRCGLIPSCLGGNCDVGRDPRHRMTDDELVAYVERQIVSARKLGFPVLRIQHFVGPGAFERLAPLAEKAGVQVACELHAPLWSGHHEVMELRDCFDRVGSDFVGFVPDFSASMTSPPNLHWERLRALDAPEEVIDTAKAVWLSDKPVPEKFGALAEAAGRFGLGDAAKAQLMMTLTMFGRAPIEQLSDLLPYTKHIHGKFYEVDASGIETSIPYPQLFALLLQAGYTGTISAEWEGHAFTEEPIGFEQVRAWKTMCSRLVGD
jgi:sugar phosphate isomerase/epimerase